MYNQVHTNWRNHLITLTMNSLVYIMYNKRLKNMNLKKKWLKNDEEFLICKDMTSDDEGYVDDEVEVIPSEL
ncbi:hypothetical protein M5K25_000530 [Dendrobium thyrsiflorum]|uniref:Uncharacterized protein n=1 Tax=Dendrobium thyrsiflorum TaxID=117978 RepID=A0ABD0VU28_DENTH